MPCFECLACRTHLHSTASEADPIGDLCAVCGSLSEPVGGLDQIAYRVIEKRGSTWHSVSGVGQPIRGCVGEIIARREFKHVRVRLEIESCDAHSLSPIVQAVGVRAPGAGDDTVRRRRARVSAAPPRVPRVLGVFGAGCDRRERRRQAKVRISPWSAGRAATWARLSRAG
jgi:hypothetical protein